MKEKKGQRFLSIKKENKEDKRRVNDQQRERKEERRVKMTARGKLRYNTSVVL